MAVNYKIWDNGTIRDMTSEEIEMIEKARRSKPGTSEVSAEEIKEDLEAML